MQGVEKISLRRIWIICKQEIFSSTHYAACPLTPLPQRSSWDEMWILGGSRERR
jgi:hypothetical protein